MVGHNERLVGYNSKLLNRHKRVAIDSEKKDEKG